MMPRTSSTRALLLTLALTTAAGAYAGRRFPAPEAAASVWVADRLFLGGAVPGGDVLTEDAWARFLDEEVTPRFPEGLTVWRAEGQWTGPDGVLVREPVLVVEVLHPADRQSEASLAAIARRYKARFHQDAVLRVSATAQARFYE